jgi:light-regulated signal transduction histidine kinase (bacteriophytochrome)
VAVVSLESVTLFRNLASNELKVLRLIAQERHFGFGSKIFQPFATHGKSHGTGLGLSICKKIVEDYSGRILARNEPGRGAIFCFSLPLAK